MRTARTDYYESYRHLRRARNGAFVGMFASPQGVLVAGGSSVLVLSACAGMDAAAVVMGAPFVLQSSGNMTMQPARRWEAERFTAAASLTA